MANAPTSETSAAAIAERFHRFFATAATEARGTGFQTQVTTQPRCRADPQPSLVEILERRLSMLSDEDRATLDRIVEMMSR
jgi:hypothetical protein